MFIITVSVLLLSLGSVRLDNNTSTGSLEDTCELTSWGTGPWGALLEEWATSDTGHSRQGRIMVLPPSPQYYVTDRVDLSPPPLPPLTPSPMSPLPPPAMSPQPRPYNEWQPPPHNPGKIVNRPPNPYKDKFKPSYPPPQPGNSGKPQYTKPTPTRPVDRVDEQPQKQVSETDLFLLGAIEKLVYRVDLMEKRLRKMEESMHFLVAGADPKPEPCVANFTRIGGTCYHFSVDPYDWKTANLACRKLRSNLLEVDSDDERRKLFAGMQADKRIGGYDFWTGGLNPGLLWIWSSSGRPINNTGSTPSTTTTSQVTIVGEGRCLALVYDPAVRTYAYRGQDCALRHRYVCEKGEDKAKLSNEIERVARALKGKGRRPKIIWED